MSRRNRLLIWLGACIALLGLIYASLPWILTGLIKQDLSARGLSNIQLRVDYPNWHGMHLHTLAFSVVAGDQQLFCEIPDVEVGYSLSELVTGTVARIRVPVAVARIESLPGSTSSAPTRTALPLAALLSGQWLADMPVRELLLAQLTVNWRVAADAVYTLQLSAQLRDAQLQISGDMHLPLPQQPIALSLNASHTGETRLLVSSVDKVTEPMLTLVVNPVVVEQTVIDLNRGEPNPFKLNGVLTGRLNSLMPILVAGLTGADWASGLEGDFNSQWQVQIYGIRGDLHGDSHWQVSGEATVQGLGGHLGDQILPRGEWSASYEADPERARLQSSLRAAGQAVLLEITGEHLFAIDSGHADLKLLPVAFSESGFVLSRLLKNWPYPFDITAGRVSGNARLVWQQAFELQGVVQLDKLGGHYKQVAFTGLSSEVTLELAKGRGKGLRTSKDALLHIDVVDVGFPVEKIDVGFALASTPGTQMPIVQIKAFSAELLGGRARSGPFELDVGRDTNAFVLQLEQIGLHEILELEQQEGLQGSGSLDGQIPVEISGAGIIVQHGQLSTVAPGGNIRYTPTPKVAAMAQSSASIKMVVNALSNYQYEVLDVITDYKPGGDLVLQVHLQGKNPQWQGGQPIHLNLNLEENIPTLLRSLQLSDAISDQVQKRYQKPP